MTSVLAHLFNAAQEHGQNSEPDHEVGDLQTLLSIAWELMTPEQRAKFICDDRIEDQMVDLDPKLLKKLRAECNRAARAAQTNPERTAA